MNADDLIRARLWENEKRSIPGVDGPDEHEPGTRPIPDGHIRFFHYTDSDEHLDRIAKEGIRLDHAKGNTYGEPNAVWAAAGNHTNHPGKSNSGKPFVEFSMSPHDPRMKNAIGAPMASDLENWTPQHSRNYEAKRAHVALYGSVTPDDIVAIHKPWRRHARYIMSEPRVVDDFHSGQHDWMKDDKEYGPVHDWVTKTFPKGK